MKLRDAKLSRQQCYGGLQQRMGEASRYIGTDRFCLSSQLGFASNFGVNRFSFSDQKRKLAYLVETADRIWA
jgi:hypothetical protein